MVDADMAEFVNGVSEQAPRRHSNVVQFTINQCVDGLLIGSGTDRTLGEHTLLLLLVRGHADVGHNRLIGLVPAITYGERAIADRPSTST